MKPYQAAIRDREALKWNTRKRMKKISSVFQGCLFCGEWEWRTNQHGKKYKHFYQPGEVYEMYQPIDVGYKYWCYLCGSKDSKCWGSRPKKTDEENVVEQQPKPKKSTIAELEEQLAQLQLLAYNQGIK